MSVAEFKEDENNQLDVAKILALSNKREPLEVLKVNAFAQGITHIADLQRFSNLTVLSLSSNSINDISGIRFCFSLTELYLRKNCLSDLRQIGYLQNLNKLNVLFLADNACSQVDKYRFKVLRCLKFLTNLDVMVVSDEDKSIALNTTDEFILSFEESVKRFLQANAPPAGSDAKDIGSTVFKGLQSDKFEESWPNEKPVVSLLNSRQETNEESVRPQKSNILEAIKLLMSDLQPEDIFFLRQMCDESLVSRPVRVSTAAATVRK